MKHFDPRERAVHSRGLVVECIRATGMHVLVALGQARHLGKCFPRIGQGPEFGDA